MVVQKYLLDGTAYFFDTTPSIDEFIFKKEIASSLNVHLRNIAIVGSGKLGFSLKPDRADERFYPFKKFDQDHRSDLDIAIISNRLFDSQLVKLYEYTNRYTGLNWWPGQARGKKSMTNYLLKGWIRPDFLPIGYKISDEINNTQSKYKMTFGRDVNIGIYKSWYFFESYHENNIRNINLNLIA